MTNFKYPKKVELPCGEYSVRVRSFKFFQSKTKTDDEGKPIWIYLLEFETVNNEIITKFYGSDNNMQCEEFITDMDILAPGQLPESFEDEANRGPIIGETCIIKIKDRQHKGKTYYDKILMPSKETEGSAVDLSEEPW